MTAEERRVVQRALEDLLHRFVTLHDLPVAVEAPFALDTMEDQEKVRLVLQLLGFEPRRAVPPSLGQLHEELKDRDPALAERIRDFAQAEEARRR